MISEHRCLYSAALTVSHVPSAISDVFGSSICNLRIGYQLCLDHVHDTTESYCVCYDLY